MQRHQCQRISPRTQSRCFASYFGFQSDSTVSNQPMMAINKATITVNPPVTKPTRRLYFEFWVSILVSSWLMVFADAIARMKWMILRMSGPLSPVFSRIEYTSSQSSFWSWPFSSYSHWYSRTAGDRLIFPFRVTLLGRVNQGQGSLVYPLCTNLFILPNIT